LSPITVLHQAKQVPIVCLDDCQTNGRAHADPASMRDLVQSVCAQGILQPLIVRPVGPGDRLEVVCGHRRLEAARQAGLSDVPAIVRLLSDEQAAAVQLTENQQREALSALDEAQAIERLIGLVGIEAAADQLGKSRTYLAGRLVLTRLPQGARLALEAGTLSLSVALLLARIPDDAMREQVAAEVQGGRPVYDPDADEPTRVPLSVAEARKAFARTMLKLDHATFDPQDGMLKKILLSVGQYSGRGDSQIRSDSGFVGPADHVSRDGDSRSWLQVAKAAKVKPVTLVVRDPVTDEPVLLWRVEELAELLPASEPAKKALPKARAELGSKAASDPKQPDGPEPWKIEEEAQPQILAAVALAAGKLTTTAFLRIEVGLETYRLPERLKVLEIKGKPRVASMDAGVCQSVIALGMYEENADYLLKALAINVKPMIAAARQRLVDRVAEAAAPPAKGKLPVSGVGATCEPCDCPPALACEAGKQARAKSTPKAKAKCAAKKKSKR
jgi:ParB/RepB/Spo0J family partition protein